MRQKHLQGTFSVLFSFSTYELLPSVVKRFCGAKRLNIKQLKSLAKPQNYAKAPYFFEVQQIIIFIFCYTELFFSSLDYSKILLKEPLQLLNYGLLFLLSVATTEAGHCFGRRCEMNEKCT